MRDAHSCALRGANFLERAVPAVVSDEVAAQLEGLGIRRDSYTLEPQNRVQKFIAARLTEAARDVPTFPLTVDLLIDALLAARADFNSKNGSRISVNDLIIKASALALQQVPAVNSSYTPLGIVRHQHVEIAIAVAAPSGLITPIVRAAETKSVTQISTEAKELAERARINKLKPDEYTGGTFSVSNLGMFGITSFGSIINPPHAAILSIGAGKPTPVVIDGEVRVATVMNVTLTCDHRVVDGAAGATWLKAFRQLIEQPASLFE
jgi:pyruvate dehydrogenase E2 component (dihydrolipoamide acetyltransferase)